MNPYVLSVLPQADYQLLLEFENGERRIFSAKHYLTRGVFTALQTSSIFSQAKVIAGSVEWPGGLDLSYDTLYLESTPLSRDHAA